MQSEVSKSSLKKEKRKNVFRSTCTSSVVYVQKVSDRFESITGQERALSAREHTTKHLISIFIITSTNKISTVLEIYY